MSDMEKEEMMRILEAHGQQLLGAFSSPLFLGKRKDTSLETPRKSKRQRTQNESEEEWSGIASSGAEEDGEESEHSEDEPLHTRESAPQARVVVFSENHQMPSKTSKIQMKAFMSSKVTKVTHDVRERLEKEGEGSDDGEELTNARNDALLHHLVHTRILSGSLDPSLDLKPAQRKKALAGRVLEAAGKAQLGKGESAVRLAERNKAAKRVREGMAAKQQERHAQQLEETKQLGNYNPALKKLYEASSQGQRRKREKGLKMGVGSFKGGVLKLSKGEINSVVGNGGRGGRGPRKRGGKR